MSCPASIYNSAGTELFSWETSKGPPLHVSPSLPLQEEVEEEEDMWGWGGGSQQASRVSSLVACDMPVLRSPAGVSQWVVGPTTPVVC